MKVFATVGNVVMEFSYLNLSFFPVFRTLLFSRSSALQHFQPTLQRFNDTQALLQSMGGCRKIIIIWGRQKMADTTKITEVHNCYTLYELAEGGSPAEKPIICFSRPQDWGDKERWSYHYARIEVGGYINHCHVWQEVKREPVEACKLIAQVLFLILMPGSHQELCDRSHLDPDDFWETAWGERPPYYTRTEPDDDWEDDDYDPRVDGVPEPEPELIPPGGTLHCWRLWHPDLEGALLEAQENPLPDPPFPTAAFLYATRSDGNGKHVMKGEGEDEEPGTGFLFGTHEDALQELAASWRDRGWRMEREDGMTRIS
jgi:hypothetical protein